MSDFHCIVKYVDNDVDTIYGPFDSFPYAFEYMEGLEPDGDTDHVIVPLTSPDDMGASYPNDPKGGMTNV